LVRAVTWSSTSCRADSGIASARSWAWVRMVAGSAIRLYIMIAAIIAGNRDVNA